jgi:histidyl-tRNA synthetase
LGLAEAVFTPTQREAGANQKLINLLETKSLDDLPENIKQYSSVQALQQLMQLLYKSGITNVIFDITLMRGFDYYTDIVFEVFDNYPENNRAMFGGGRYDGLLTIFGADPIPTVGFGMGDVTLQNFLEVHGLLPSLRPETDLYIALIGDVYERSLGVIEDLRDMGLKVAVDISARKPEKQIKAAIKKGINYVLFIGENELNDEQYTLKNLHTGQEERHGASRIVSIIKDYRQE